MNRRTESCQRMLRYRPPRIAMFLLMTASLLQLATASTLPATPGSAFGGAVAGLLGLAIMLRAWWLFRTHETAICPTSQTTILITKDVYRLTRNPMYLGIVLMLLGIALGIGGLPYYVAALAFFVVINHVFCPYEEDKLRRDFGSCFEDYEKRVRRWL